MLPMQVRADPPEVLLTREGRGRLSFFGLLRLYLDPFPFFRDVRSGDLFLRDSSLRHNRALAPMLRTYLARWAVLLTLFFAGCIAFQAAVPLHRLFAVLMMFAGIGLAWSMAAVCLLGAGYVLLTRAPEPPPERRR
jgi:hypothetical protein